MKSAVFSLAVFYILLLGCSDDNNITSPTVQTQEIVPLSIDNSWTYQYTIYDTSGGIIYTSIDSFSVIADTVINGKKHTYNPVLKGVALTNRPVIKTGKGVLAMASIYFKIASIG